MGHSYYAVCFHVHIIYNGPSDLNYVPRTPKYALLTVNLAINANQQKKVDFNVLIVILAIVLLLKLLFECGQKVIELKKYCIGICRNVCVCVCVCVLRRTTTCRMN